MYTKDDLFYVSLKSNSLLNEDKSAMSDCPISSKDANDTAFSEDTFTNLKTQALTLVFWLIQGPWGMTDRHPDVWSTGYI